MPNKLRDLTVTREVALEAALRYIAYHLENRELYDAGTDEFIHGPELDSALSRFARKIAANKLPNWASWVATKPDRY